MSVSAPPPSGVAVVPSVRRSMSRLIVVNVVLLVAMGVVAIVLAVASTQSVTYLTQKVVPASRASSSTIQELTDAETHLRGWSLSGEKELLDRHRASLADYRVDQVHLLERARIDGTLLTLVRQQEVAAKAWINGYAVPRTDNPGGVAGYDQALFDRGYVLFNELRAANKRVADRIDVLSREARAGADDRLRRATLALVLATLLGAGLTYSWARRTGRRVVDPLVRLEGTVNRLASGDHVARAELDGPREIRRVARALNVLAEENQRARDVETEIVEHLRDLDSVKSDFVSNVSHELRTPLTSIGGYVEMLEEQLGDRIDAHERDMLHAARRNVSRLRELIEDLLTLTRAEARSTDLRSIDLVPMLREVVSDLGIAAAQRGVRISLQVPDEPVVVLADVSQLARAVTNLVTNAIKYSHGAPQVEVVLDTAGDDAAVRVRDHGIGIPTEEMAELGSRFYRASNAVRLGISGTGLGLRIVQAILDNHRGVLEIDSQQGVGTTVTMRVPLQARLAPTPGQTDA